MAQTLYSLEFKVTGRVQGVFFRKHTKQTASGLALKGYVQNNADKSVHGVVQGDLDKIEEFEKWVCNVGSPKSKIADCSLDRTKIDAYSYTMFTIKK
jgi:acylphosphatase